MLAISCRAQQNYSLRHQLPPFSEAAVCAPLQIRPVEKGSHPIRKIRLRRNKLQLFTRKFQCVLGRLGGRLLGFDLELLGQIDLTTGRKAINYK